VFLSRLDYTIALLRLLETLPNRLSRSQDVQQLFLREYQDEIPPEDFEELSSGGYRWAKEVQWSRYECVRKGLMDAPAKGVWQITEKGIQWLWKKTETIQSPTHKPVARIKTQSDSYGTEKGTTATKSTQSDIFFTALEDNLQSSLKPIVENTHFNYIRRSNYLQIRLAGFGGCHYEIILRRTKHEIALHFESSAERSQARLRSFEPHIESLSQTLKMPVYAGAFQTRGWTQVCIETPPKPLTASLVEEFAYLVEQFVAATFPILKTVYAGDKTAHTATSNMEKFTSGHPMHAILDQEVINIRLYLEGRSSIPTSDEKLCDWVNFCYIFRLYSEGRELFSLVNGAEVNPWYFERTKRIAKVCEQKMNLFESREE
jgi:hypothetical protein